MGCWRSAGTRWRSGTSWRGELEILHLIIRGLTDAEIAAELVVSRRTVGHHVSDVLQKLGAPNRSRATLMARELGIDP